MIKANWPALTQLYLCTIHFKTKNATILTLTAPNLSSAVNGPFSMIFQSVNNLLLSYKSISML